MIGLLLLVAIVFGFPLWIIWTVKELFGLDWHTKYWAIWSMLIIINIVFNSSNRSK